MSIEDPLEIGALSESFDILVSNINKETEKLANQIYLHVSEKNQISDDNLLKLNENLKKIKSILNDSNNLNMEIDKLQQLQLFTRDFNQRILNVETALKQTKLINKNKN
jgi:hypothetical protein